MFFCTTPKSLERENRDLEFSKRVFWGKREKERKNGKVKTFEEREKKVASTAIDREI